MELPVIRSLNVVKYARDFRSTKHSIFWHLRLQLGIKLTDMALDLKVDHYLGWTLDISQLILLIWRVTSLIASLSLLYPYYCLYLLNKWKMEELNL